MQKMNLEKGIFVEKKKKEMTKMVEKEQQNIEDIKETLQKEQIIS